MHLHGTQPFLHHKILEKMTLRPFRIPILSKLLCKERLNREDYIRHYNDLIVGLVGL